MKPRQYIKILLIQLLNTKQLSILEYLRNLIAMASNLLAMASNLEAMASNLLTPVYLGIWF